MKYIKSWLVFIRMYLQYTSLCGIKSGLSCEKHASLFKKENKSNSGLFYTELLSCKKFLLKVQDLYRFDFIGYYN